MACTSSIPRPTAHPRVVATARARLAWTGLARVFAVSAAVVVPCFWQSRIQAGDLASHMYTASLANLASDGKLSGIAVVSQFTNVLFDLAASWMLRVAPGLAERLVVSAAVLVFFWGAFSLASAAARCRPWRLAPVLAMLAYGWVFHAGFLNFYIGLGLGFAAIGLVLRRTTAARLAGAAGLLAAAVTAHITAAAWAAGGCLYIVFFRRFTNRSRWILAGGGVVIVLAVRLACSALFITGWTPLQLVSLSGAEQLWVYGVRAYLLPTLGLVLIWTLLGVRRLEGDGSPGDSAALLAPLAAVTMSAVALLPDYIKVPGVASAFSFIAYRTSLAAAVLISAAIAGVRPTRGETCLIAAVAALFFSVSYRDARRLNAVEDRIEAAVRALPPGQRVLNGLCWPEARIDPALHMLDRACIGHCFSYGAYEPSSKQFRVRVTGKNAFVLSTRQEVADVETGQYRVTSRDLPLYLLEWRGPARLVGLRPLQAGEVVGRNCEVRPPKL